MTFSNDPTGNDATEPRPDPSAGDESARDAMIAELIDEMTSWNPQDRMKAFRSWLKGSLSLVHLHVLTVLEADGPQSMSRVAELLDVSVASATGIIGRMEERGLVERSHGETDRRVVIVSPTPAGRAVFHDMRQTRRQQLTLLLGRLSDDELNALLIGLRAMRNARQELHIEKAKEGLVAVTLSGAEASNPSDVTIAAENATVPRVTIHGDAPAPEREA